MQLTNTEAEVYSQLQKDILACKAQGTYIIENFGIRSNQQVESFLLRTVLGFHIDSLSSVNGPIPLVPDVVTKEFINICSTHATQLDCIRTHKAYQFLEEALAERALRVYEISHLIHCPFIAAKAAKKLTEVVISPQWFSNYCKHNNLKLINPQSLEELRRKFCHSNVVMQFFIMLSQTIHQIPHLLYNMDETSVATNRKGKIVVPNGSFPLAEEEREIGHMTLICSCNAAGEALKPFIVLPMLVNLPAELLELTTQSHFASTPSGWMTSKLFLIWAAFFADEINKRRSQLIGIYGQQIQQTPCFLILDGHKSRLNGDAIELLYSNNIRIIVLPAHTSHVTQPFDVCIASPFKAALARTKDSMPSWVFTNIQTLTQTARKRFTTIVAVIDAWKKAATITNIKSAFEKTGIYPLNMQRVLTNKYVRQSTQGDAIAPINHQNRININAMEITTFQKRLEISKHFHNDHTLIFPKQLPNPVQIAQYFRDGHEKYLSPSTSVVLWINGNVVFFTI